MYQAAVPAMLSEDEIAKRREAAQGKAALEAMVATGEDKGVSASYSGAERHVWNPEGPLSGDDRTLKSSCEPNQPNQPNPTLTHKNVFLFPPFTPPVTSLVGFVRTRIVGMEEASVARASPGPDGIALQPLEDDEQVLEAITRSNFNPDQVKLMLTAKIGVGRGESTLFPRSPPCKACNTSPRRPLHHCVAYPAQFAQPAAHTQRPR